MIRRSAIIITKGNEGDISVDRDLARVYITEKAERVLRAGHLWVYGAEISRREGAYANGDIVDVLSKKGRWLGAGFINDISKIGVRIISQNSNDRFDQDFFSRRLQHALAYRARVMGEDFCCCRLIFGEADFFPGLTVDRFEEVLVTEVLCCGLDRLKDRLYPELVRQLREDYRVEISALYERNEAPLREKEGLERYQGFYPLPGLAQGDGHVLIRENGLLYDVDYIKGQKTGFFLDQKYNRAAVARLCAGRRVLDCCTHSGAFALNAAQAGAARVTAVDISQDALDQARANAARNGLEKRVDFLRADVFDLLSQLTQQKCHDYDLIILDPPAFTKSGATVGAAYGGYKEINMKAMRLLPRGGYLATCSCSHFMTNDLFKAMLEEAARDAGVRIRQIEARQQAADHPILLGVPETNYLKFYLLQVV